MSTYLLQLVVVVIAYLVLFTCLVRSDLLVVQEREKNK